MDTRLLAQLQESATRLTGTAGIRSFADWVPHSGLAGPFADDVVSHVRDRLAKPLAIYERTDHFVHRLTGEARSERTATVLHPTTAPSNPNSIELPFAAWRDDLGDLSPYNPRMQELLDLTRTLPAVPHDDPNVRGVYLSLVQDASGPKLTIEDRELVMLVAGRGYARHENFTLQGPADALAAARPFMHRDGLPPDALITRSNDLLLAIRDRNGMTTNLPETQRIAITSHMERRR